MDYHDIYAHHADDYDRLVAAEDWEGRLGPAIAAIARLEGAHVLEVGAGTGRITRLLLTRGAHAVAVDRAPAMLEVARRNLAAFAPESWQLLCADAEALPVPDNWADVAIAGWVFGHFRSWHPQDWRGHVQRGLDEMARALRPGGALILIETLGTGSLEPAPPSLELAEYFDWLEKEQGMRRVAIRTDYGFSDVATAAATTGAFFGAAFAERVRREQWARVPECTGLWWRRGGSAQA